MEATITQILQDKDKLLYPKSDDILIQSGYTLLYDDELKLNEPYLAVFICTITDYDKDVDRMLSTLDISLAHIDNIDQVFKDYLPMYDDFGWQPNLGAVILYTPNDLFTEVYNYKFCMDMAKTS